jgi:predicted secreted Zn-dependent protease
MAKIAEVPEVATSKMQKAVAEILQQAEATGTKSNFFFATTFKRYQVQMRIMAELEKAMDEEGPLIEKEYVKGRKNLVANPAITEYNKTATAANGTVGTLINILKQLSDDSAGKSKLQELMAALNE